MQNLKVLVLSNLFFQHVEEVFIEELLLAHEVLPEDELFDLVNKIENGLAKASETFKKWMYPWMHLTLSISIGMGICKEQNLEAKMQLSGPKVLGALLTKEILSNICSKRKQKEVIIENVPTDGEELGSSNDPEFAHAIFHVFFSDSYNVGINLHEKNYIELLERDKLKGINQSFGLLETLQEQDFLDEFQSFSASVASDLYKFPLLYDFVKYRIWSIVVHEQQIESLFNKYDNKTHPNMKKPLQES
nr:366_t:CDS:2 [Entrophospora candida]